GQRRFADAVSAFLRTAAIAPEVPQPYVFLGRILGHAEGRIAEVLARFSAFARQNPRSHVAQFLYGKALAAQPGTEAEAEKRLRRSIELDASFWESHFELAQLLERRRDWKGAAAQFEAAARLNPASPAPHYRLARIYDRLGQPDRAAAERALHEKLTAEEKAAIEKHKSGVR
ncbi:MAG: tetratricopeptide repeat protein, partial [Bryobacteraceae bacterium]